MMNELSLVKKSILTNFNALKEPYKLTFAITYRCNSRCKTCGIWKKKSSNELGLDEVENFAKKSNFFSWVNLTGGEPFLRNDIVDIAETFLKNSKALYILNTTTNGYLPDRVFEKTQEMLSLNIPRCIVVISLDGYRELHERIRGVRGSWEKAMESFKLLKILSAKNKNFQTFFGYTISPLNLGKFNETFLSVKEIIPEIEPKDFHVNLFHSSEHYFANSGNKISLESEAGKTLADLSLIEELRNNGSITPANFVQSFLEKKYVELAKDFIKNSKTPLPCKVLQSSVFLDPYGNVFPCTVFNRLLGNIRDNKYELKKVIETDEVKELIERIQKLECPNCWTPCEAYQTILGNLVKATV